MRTKKSQLPAIPAPLADCALITGPEFAAASGCSISQLHDLVRRGDAPPPAVKLPRFTRWRLADAKAWLIARAEQSAADQETAALVTARAKRASEAAQTKRIAATEALEAERAKRAVSVAPAPCGATK